jgi:lipopolysaccharide transport system ATP-binding protein
MVTIRFENVSKMFRQRHAGAPDGDLWVLRDVSFECREGEVLGLVGRNGCGKSTLLKLAANVSSPTSGKVTCIQPIAPMLELGAGFHHDLTGRDNIYFNGCLLGLGRRLSPTLVDEIVSFAELQEHIDTPVKHYSSGMYARLAFAVAVHSPARLLLVDEVLSVGDKLFQQKCLARMKFLRDRGTTIVLVSHDNWWIRNFCSRAMVIDAGRVIADGDPNQALQRYDWRLRGLLGENSPEAGISRVEVLPDDGSTLGTLRGSRLRVRVCYEAASKSSPLRIVARVRRDDGIDCVTCVGESPDSGSCRSALIDIEDLHLVPGAYVVEVSIEDSLSRAALATLSSEQFSVPGLSDSGRGYDGVMKVRHRWSYE